MRSETLTRAAARGQLAHQVAVLAIEETERRAITACRAELDTAAVPVLDAPVRGYGSDPARNLSQLRAADAPTGQALTATEHAACPGHAAYIDTDEVWAQDPDGNTTDTDELPQGITAQPRYVCTDPSRYRHLNLWAAPPTPATPTRTTPMRSPGRPKPTPARRKPPGCSAPR